MQQESKIAYSEVRGKGSNRGLATIALKEMQEMLKAEFVNKLSELQQGKIKQSDAYKTKEKLI